MTEMVRDMNSKLKADNLELTLKLEFYENNMYKALIKLNEAFKDRDWFQVKDVEGILSQLLKGS